MHNPGRKIFLFMVLLLAIPGWSAAQPIQAEAGGTSLTAQSHTLDLPSALRLAAQNNKDYQMARSREQAAAAAWWQALLALGPTASLQAGYVLENQPMVMSLMGQDFEVDTNYYSGQVRISQPLFTGGKLLNSLRLAGLANDNAKASTELAWSQMVVDVTEAFYQAVLSQRQLAVTEESLNRMRKHLDTVKARYGEGLASNYDLLRTEVQVANMEPAVLKLRTAVRLASRRLAALISGNQEDLPPLQGSLEVREEPWPELSGLTSQALARRLEIKNLERTRRMSEIGQTLAATGNLPNVALNAAWTHYDTRDSAFPPLAENLKHYWELSVGVQWPFWDNLAAWPKAEAAAAKTRETVLGQQSLEDGIRLEVESDYLTLTAALETVRVQAKAVDLAKTGYDIAARQYGHGLLSNIEIMDAQLALDQAQNNYLQAQYDYLIASIRLHQAVGDKL